MRVAMGIIKNEHGVYNLRKKVPKNLTQAVAEVMGSSKPSVSWLKKSLGTKDRKLAKVRAAPILMEFDRILAKAEAQAAERPLRTPLPPIFLPSCCNQKNYLSSATLPPHKPPHFAKLKSINLGPRCRVGQQIRSNRSHLVLCQPPKALWFSRCPKNIAGLITTSGCKQSSRCSAPGTWSVPH